MSDISAPVAPMWGLGVIFFLAGVVFAWGLERWVLTGLLVPVRVVSGSMAPQLWGPHGRTLCEDCHFRFEWDAAKPHADNSRVCPNCGASAQANSTTWHRGERVLIRRAGYRPRRWDVVVVNLPGDPTRPPHGEARHRWSVKRIVGLPGEQIALRRGEVWIGHQQLRKDWSAQRCLSLLVHDDVHRASNVVETHPERWQGDPQTTQWKSTPIGYQSQSPDREHHRRPSPAVDWLTYHHRACFASPSVRRSELPMRDHSGYNQSLSRPLHEISDLFVRFRCRLQGPRRSRHAALQVRVHDGHGDLYLKWNADGQFEWTHDDHFRWQTTLPPLPINQWFHVVAGTWDGQVVLVIDDVQQTRTDYPPMPHTWQPTSRPLAIGAPGWRQVDLTEVSVWRDVYYTHPDDLETDWTLAEPLGPGEYLLLGDNSPASLDGRHGRQHGVVSRNEIIGCVHSFP